MSDGPLLDELRGYRLRAVSDAGDAFILSDGRTARVVTADGSLMPPREFRLALGHGIWRAPEAGDPSVEHVISRIKHVIAPGDRDLQLADPETLGERLPTDPLGHAPVTEALDGLLDV